MSEFTDSELDYLNERRPERLGRIATVGRDGTPHVVPVGWRLNTELDAIEVGGMNLDANQEVQRRPPQRARLDRDRRSR